MKYSYLVAKGITCGSLSYYKMSLTVNYGVTKANLRRFIIAGTIAYTALVLYFMFYGFNRIDEESTIISILFY